MGREGGVEMGLLKEQKVSPDQLTALLLVAHVATVVPAVTPFLFINAKAIAARKLVRASYSCRQKKGT